MEKARVTYQIYILSQLFSGHRTIFLLRHKVQYNAHINNIFK